MNDIVKTISCKNHDFNIRVSSKNNKKNGRQYKYYSCKINVGKDPVRGRQIQYEITAPTLEQCEDKLMREIGMIPTSEQSKRMNITVRDWLEYTFKLRAFGYENSSKRNRKSMEKNHILPYIGDKKLSELTPDVIADMYQTLEKKGMQPNRIRTLNSYLSKSLDVAVRQKIIPFNPCVDILMPRATHAKRLPIWEEEIADFIEEASKTPFYHLFVVMLTTGLRISEALGLSWDDIIEERDVIYVHQQVEQSDENGKSVRRIKNTTKNKRPRFVAFSEELYEHFEAEREKQRQNQEMYKSEWDNKDNLIFTNKYGGQLVIKTVQNYLKQIAESIDRKDVSLHSLRHTYLSFMYDETGDIVLVQLLAGHQSPSTTLDYLELFRRKQDRVILANANMYKLMYQNRCFRTS